MSARTLLKVSFTTPQPVPSLPPPPRSQWCGPCRSFTPLLTVAYEDAVEADPADVEIVFVTADFDSASFSEYFGKMPWAAVPFKAGNPIGQALGDVFGVRGIPALIALSGDDGSVLSTEARSLVQSKRSFAALDALPKQPPRHRGQHGAVVEEGATLWSLISDFLLCGLFCARRRGQPGGKDE